MKISIGFKKVSGPYGGGNQFLINLQEFLESRNHTVVDNLNDNDIDVILLTNPLIDSDTSTYNSFDVENYLKFTNPNSIVFQRINECDERKNTKNINDKINKFNQTVDINIYVSNWLREIFSNYEMGQKESYVVLGGPSSKTFNTLNKEKWTKKQKVKLVTHHWSNNWLKGFDEYQYIDHLLSQENIKNSFEFTYIGNVPENFEFINSKIIKPLQGLQLANELKNHHVYITASKNEPSGNHHMEGAMCGLPILYVNSGGIPEYCNEYGVEFSKFTFQSSLEKILQDYFELVKNLENYSFTFENAAVEYLNIFQKAIENKDEIINRRKYAYSIQVKLSYYINKFAKIKYLTIVNIRKLIGKLKK